MFDELYFEKPYIKCPCGCGITYFQTKSLDNVMAQYRLTVDNQLQVEEYSIREPRPEEQTDIKGVKFPLWIKEHTGWANTDLTTTLNLHNLCPQCGKYWFDVVIVVIYGKVDKIDVFPHELKIDKEDINDEQNEN